MSIRILFLVLFLAARASAATLLISGGDAVFYGADGLELDDTSAEVFVGSFPDGEPVTAAVIAADPDWMSSMGFELLGDFGSPGGEPGVLELSGDVDGGEVGESVIVVVRGSGDDWLVMELDAEWMVKDASFEGGELVIGELAEDGFMTQVIEPVPEPAVILMLAAAAMLMLCRRDVAC